jgi:hypothetical protein
MDIAQVHENFRKNLCLYFRKLRKLTSFERYPALPLIDSVLPWKRIEPIPGVEAIAEWVEQLVKQRDIELACDVWMVVTMGLHPEQLK